MRADPFAQATQSLAHDDDEAVLETLLTAWRETRHPDFAKAIDAVSARLAPHLPAFEASPFDAFQAQWLAVAKQRRAVDLPRLLESVTAGSSRFGTAVVQAMLARGEALRGWPADPRSGSRIVEHLVDAGYESKSGSTFSFWGDLFELIIAHGDTRLISTLSKVNYAKIYRHFSDGKRRIIWFQQRVDAATEALRALVVPGSKHPLLKAPTAAFLKRLNARPVSDATKARLANQATPVAKPKPPKRKETAETRTVYELLEGAARSLTEADDKQALTYLLSAWRMTPSPEISGLIDTVSKRLDSQCPAITGGKREANQKLWLEVAAARNPSDVPRLLRSLTDTMFRSTDALARLNIYLTWPRDPRTAEHAIAAMRRPAFKAGSTKPFWAALIALVADHADPRAPDQLEALAKRMPTVLHDQYTDHTALIRWFQRQLTDAAATIRAKAVSRDFSPDALAALTAVHNVIGGPDAAFMARIAEQPSDLNARAVFADHLQQRGDPRGEFIALQLANRDAPRVEALHKAHAHRWVGSLLPFIDLAACTFSGGFLSDVTLTTTGDGFVNTSGDAIWATVKHVHWAGRPSKNLDVVLQHAVMRSLER